MSILEIFGIVLLLGGFAGLIVSGVMYLGDLRNPLRQTNKQERRDARALRKENAMPFWGRLVQSELTWNRWKTRVVEVIQNDQEEKYQGRHRRTGDQLPSEALQRAFKARFGRTIHVNIVEAEA